MSRAKTPPQQSTNGYAGFFSRREEPGPAFKVYRDLDDMWVGYYRGPEAHYVCLLPTVVIRWPRKGI